ncbi:hypothetical protein [Pseudobacter ginsenosidimutans]|uniref:Uncharacterized protein n=1 Tax=Pseudobacter ginsenosidimutans TaxID=661488 RepID=A0A4Q7N452_9BACT|nr:hypothetical protein [Pseudobacter ginsenosidimutans]QEC44304.1 hypothetical protein FSB84_22465 [Pseudobacter ginsenosidimutans]RZS75764.1 hypothetical protein EV199_1637 [Pseudobacter ginsenosidimutans]
MKALLCLFLIISGSTLIAQKKCNSSHVLFSPPSGTLPQPIKSLGNNPQIKCLRNVRTKQQFLNAIKTCLSKEIYKQDLDELNELLQQIGLSNGTADLTEENLNFGTIPFGTRGMLGYKKNKQIGYLYAELVPEGQEGVKGWKITGPDGCFLYIFTACGNAFYPEQPCPGCPTVNISTPADEVKIECEAKTKLKEVVTELVLVRQKKTRIPKTKTSGARRELRDIDSFVVSSQRRTFEVADGVKTNYSVKLSPYTFNGEICTDSTINIPLKLEKLETATAAVESSSSTEYIRIREYVNRRTLKYFRKIKKVTN